MGDFYLGFTKSGFFNDFFDLRSLKKWLSIKLSISSKSTIKVFFIVLLLSYVLGCANSL